MPTTAALDTSCDHVHSYMTFYRRNALATRRTATTVLAGSHVSLETHDRLTMLQSANLPPPDTSASVYDSPQLALASASLPGLRGSNDDVAAPSTTTRRGTAASTATGSSVKAGRAKAKPKAPAEPRIVDMGVSIIPICIPGTGTPSPPPERRPPLSFGSTTSSSITMPGFDLGGAYRAGAATAGGKRARGLSQSQLPISPPVTSPNTSTSELPFAYFDEPSRLSSPPPLPPPKRTKRTRGGREAAQRRKRRKTETRPDPPSSSTAHVDEAVRSQKKAPAGRAPPAWRKGWKGWIMVSDTEGSDAERAETPPIVILETKTRSGRDFDREVTPRVNRRGRSTVSIGAESVATSAAPLSSATAV